MMSCDVNVAESIHSPDENNKYESIHDERLDRDIQKDLHIAIDLSFEFVKGLKNLHPIAFGQIKTMLIQGKLI